MGELGRVFESLRAFGRMWAHLGASWAILHHRKRFGESRSMWECMEVFGSVWERFGAQGDVFEGSGPRESV